MWIARYNRQSIIENRLEMGVIIIILSFISGDFLVF
jgi:hypothetical protein